MKSLNAKSVQGLKDVARYTSGDQEGFRATEVNIPNVDIRALRSKLNLTQSDFSQRYGIPLATIQNWEQGHRQPESIARMFLKLIECDPEGTYAKLRSTPLVAG